VGLWHTVRHETRHFVPDRCYHLISRIANRSFYFGEEERTGLVARMWRVAYFSCVEVLAYCVMSNHFHILAYVPPPHELDEGEVLARVRTLYTGERLADFERAWTGLVHTQGRATRRQWRLPAATVKQDCRSLPIGSNPSGRGAGRRRMTPCPT